VASQEVSIMSLLKRIGVVVVAIIMVLSIAGASAAFAVNGTVLDSDQLTDTFEEEGVYASVATEGQDRISDQLNTTLDERADEIPAGITLDFDSRAAAETALTEAYVDEEVSANVEQLLAYLNGDAEELALAVDLVPVKDSLGEYVANDTIAVDTVALANERGVNVTTAGVTVDSEMLVRLNENQEGYEQTRIQLRSQAVEGADVPVSIDANGSVVVDTETFLRNTEFEAERNGVTVDTAMLVRMNANATGYADARADIRSQGLAQEDVPIDVAEDGSIEVDTVDIAREANFSSDSQDVSIDDAMIARLNANQSGYDAVRVDVRRQAVEEFPVTVDENGEVVVDTVDIAQEQNVTAEQDFTVDDGMIARLNANQSGYDAVRLDVRRQAVEEFPVTVDENGEVVVDTVDIARELDFSAATDRIDVTDDMIERMNEGPDGYAAVREEIRDQVREDLPSFATASQVDTALEEINAELKANATAQARDNYGEDVSEDTLDDIVALQNTTIDGLTDPDLEDYDTYATRRDDDESALADSFGRELDDGLREANEEMKATAADQIRTEYGDEDIENETVQNIIALQNTVIDGLTHPDLTDFDEYASQRDADEAALGDSFDRELDDGLLEANKEIKADAAEQARERYGDSVSNETLDDIVGLQNTVIDGLTHPDLDDYDEYASQRDDAEAALETALTAELEDRLREANEEIKVEAAEQARDQYGEDVSDETLDDIVGLQNTVIDGLTHPDLDDYDEYASQRDENEAALEDSFDRELTTKLSEAGTDVKADAAERIRNEYGDRVSEATLDDVVALQNTVIDGLTHPDLSYDGYASQRDDAEAALADSLATELRQRIDDRVDDRIELGNVTGEQADALNTARTGVGLLGTLTLVLPLVFLALIGVVYAITRSIHRTVATTGYSLLVAGIVGAAVGLIARAPVLDIVDTALESSEDELSGTGIGEAIRSIIESLFGALTMQSVVLAIVGVVLVAVVLAEKRGHLEALKERAGRVS